MVYQRPRNVCDCKVTMLCHDDDIKLLKQASGESFGLTHLQFHPAAGRHSPEEDHFGISRYLVRSDSRRVSHRCTCNIQVDLICGRPQLDTTDLLCCYSGTFKAFVVNMAPVYSNQQILLKSRPDGFPTLANFEHAKNELSQQPPGPQDVIVQLLDLSVDPYLRGRMNAGKSYVPGFELGKVCQLTHQAHTCRLLSRCQGHATTSVNLAFALLANISFPKLSPWQCLLPIVLCSH